MKKITSSKPNRISRPKNTKPKPKKKTAQQLAKTERNRKLKEWSLKVRDRDGNKCVVCGKDTFIQAHHLAPKKQFPELMYEIEVGISVCPSHHVFGKANFEQNMIFAYEWLKKHRPKQFRWLRKKVYEQMNNE